MGRRKSIRLADILSDRFSDVWKLLSETTLFLSRIGELPSYENQLRSWRLELQNSRKKQEIYPRIRSELTALRRMLRLQGYDLSLVKQNLVFDGFRNDASLGQGFTRVVLFISGDDIYWLCGDENHISLASHLERQMGEWMNSKHIYIRITARHFLWYRRRGCDLILSGSDTEAKEDYAHLKAAGEANTLWFLAKLKNLR
ncbi:MAG: hypothetical protein LBJ24_04945 [Treponema sp.]|jgi:hypothetical protein|nr:hypothetical protein [Treponema sp.]